MCALAARKLDFPEPEASPPAPDSKRASHPARIMSTWWRHTQVRAHLDVDPKTLRARMDETPDHIERPWINVGTLGRPD